MKIDMDKLGQAFLAALISTTVISTINIIVRMTYRDRLIITPLIPTAIFIIDLGQLLLTVHVHIRLTVTLNEQALTVTIRILKKLRKIRREELLPL